MVALLKDQFPPLSLSLSLSLSLLPQVDPTDDPAGMLETMSDGSYNSEFPRLPAQSPNGGAVSTSGPSDTTAGMPPGQASFFFF